MPSPSVALLRTQSDTRLVALASAGHERAFEAIVERYRRQLMRHARRYLPEARAEDALQQALVAAWTALRRGDDVRELRPWLHRIVHNAALNALRAPGYDYEQLQATLQGSGGPAELAERRAIVHRTLAGLAALPERQRQALLQIAVEGRSQDEVAEELGLTQGAVRQLVHRARTALRAAATAVVPLPLAIWLATAGADRGDVAVRVGELVAGAGGSATLAKAGAVAVIAGGAVAGPAVVHDVSDRDRRPVAEPAARADAETDRAPADAPAAPVNAPPVVVEHDVPSGGPPSRDPGPGGEQAGARQPDRDDGGRGDRDDGERRPGERGDRRHDGDGRSEDDERSRHGDDRAGARGDDGTDRHAGSRRDQWRGDDEDHGDDEDRGDDEERGDDEDRGHDESRRNAAPDGDDGSDDDEDKPDSDDETGGSAQPTWSGGPRDDDGGDSDDEPTSHGDGGAPPAPTPDDHEDDDSSGSGSSDD